MKLAFPVSKSAMAFRFNVDKLFQWGKVYMWTFTFVKCQPDHRAMMRWAELQDKLKRLFPNLIGLRVVEVHPGTNFHGLSHGLHFHALFNQRIPVGKVRRIASRLDFGSIKVARVTKDEANYLSKYLSKGQPELQKGTRRWGTFNWPAASKVRGISIESDFHRNFRQIQKLVGRQQLTPDVVHSVYVNTKLFGSVKKWPVERYYYSGRSRVTISPEDVGIPAKQIRWKDLVLPRSNKQKKREEIAVEWWSKTEFIKLQRLSTQGKLTTKQWKEQSALIRLEARARRQDLGLLAQAKEASNASEKKFYNICPPGCTRENPCKELSQRLSIPADYWDTFPIKTHGTLTA